jgi:hypothetical protein
VGLKSTGPKARKKCIYLGLDMSLEKRRKDLLFEAEWGAF